MATAQIAFTNADVENLLLIEFGGEPGWPAFVEISSARCLKVTDSAGPITVTIPAEQVARGDKLLELHGDEMAEMVLGILGADDEWHREQAAESAAERREELRRERRPA